MHDFNEYSKKIGEINELSNKYNENKNSNNLNNLENKIIETFGNDILNTVNNSYNNNQNENNSGNALIHREYDFSNSMPIIEYVTYLVKYMENIYNKYLTIMDEDEKNNIQFKDEYKNYNYKNFYSVFDISIYEKKNDLTLDDYYHCENYNDFIELVKKSALNNVKKMNITMKIDFRRGRGNNLEKYNNNFSLSFAPYKIVFVYKSNVNNPEFIKIEKEIIDILNQFPKINTIFCTKE